MITAIKNAVVGKSLKSVLASLDKTLADLGEVAAQKSREAANALDNISKADADYREKVAALTAQHAAVTKSLGDVADAAQAESDRANTVAQNLSALLVK